jgi:putative FmdB family regulatory protein
MPTYDYKCNSCGNRFEVFQSMSSEPVKECPECGGEVRRLIGTGSGPIFKGSGFTRRIIKIIPNQIDLRRRKKKKKKRKKVQIPSRF